MSENKAKEYLIYTLRVAVALREQGFKILRVGVNKRYPQYDVWAFADTPAFRAALTTITKKG